MEHRMTQGQLICKPHRYGIDLVCLPGTPQAVGLFAVAGILGWLAGWASALRA